MIFPFIVVTQTFVSVIVIISLDEWAANQESYKYAVLIARLNTK